MIEFLEAAIANDVLNAVVGEAVCSKVWLKGLTAARTPEQESGFGCFKNVVRDFCRFTHFSALFPSCELT